MERIPHPELKEAGVEFQAVGLDNMLEWGRNLGISAPLITATHYSLAKHAVNGDSELRDGNLPDYIHEKKYGPLKAVYDLNDVRENGYKGVRFEPISYIKQIFWLAQLKPGDKSSESPNYVVNLNYKNIFIRYGEDEILPKLDIN